ncbi:hypothetical protein [Microvirga tunisiensis]|uniref:Lipoprotein n=1 Tax=Microvirga tunisiensis TaxID=2108360 RepID=A0A5N7MAQ6_9HYPH|nr:hypothetical protein [Microvirga tunisiensis]MPR05637.1 hypothetical protein [Microvirga tunisiensis]MPR23837.1 hypothetical protein [Microvirga tunisiensis]
MFFSAARQIRLGSIAFAAAVFVAGCSQNSIEPGDVQAVRDSYEDVVSSLSDNPGQVRGFSLALYRIAVPGKFPEISDDFDPSKPLPVAVDRGAMPAIGTDTFFEAIVQAAPKVAGMTPATIVNKYVSEDSMLLSRQEAWVRDWQVRNRIRVRNERQEAERRQQLLSQFHPIRPSYSWWQSKPVLRFSIFNPLDVPLTKVGIDLDLFDANGQALASGFVEGALQTPLQPGTETTAAFDLSRYEAFSRRGLQSVVGGFQVVLKVKNVWSGQKSLIDTNSNVDAVVEARQNAVIDLLSKIREARENLSKFRITFDEGKTS